MAVVSSISVLLKAKTTAFISGMRRARKALKKFHRQTKFITKPLIKLGTVLSGVAVGGMLLFVRNAFKMMDTIGKVSDKLGITTQNLLTLRYAAQLTGVAANTLDMALQRMTRRLAEAAIGTGEAKAALEELQKYGLPPAYVLAAMDVGEAFKYIADAISQVEDPSQRVRLAFKLFDSEGVALVNTLALGRAGLDAAAKELRKLGGMFSRVDASTIERANETVAKLKIMLQGAGTVLAVQLAPHVTALAAKLIEAGTAGRGMGMRLIGALESVAKAVGKVLDLLTVFRMAWKALQIGALGVLTAVLGGLNMLAKGIIELINLLPGVEIAMGDAMGGFIKGLEAQLKATVEELDGIRREPWPSEKIDKFFDNVKRGAERAAEAIDKVRPPIGDDGGDEKRAWDKRTAELAPSLKRALDEVKTPLERHEERIKELQELHEHFPQLFDSEKLKRAMALAEEKFRGIKDAVREIVSPGAALKGSREAYTAEVRHRLEGGRDKVEKDQLTVAKEQAKRLYAIEGLLYDWTKNTQRVRI